MKVRYIAHSGSDLLVVNAARVSMAKRSEWQVDGKEIDPESRTIFPVYTLSKKDKKLIRYLAKHNHWTPFGHPTVTLHVKVPIFVARQLMRSNVGIVYNEVSRRYVDTDPEFWWPDGGETGGRWRARAEGVKQGSKQDEFVTDLKKPDGYLDDDQWATLDVNTHVKYTIQQAAEDMYKWLLDSGVAPELARVVLPQNVYTEFYMTGSLAAFARVCKLRLDPHAQKEIRDVAEQIAEIVGGLYPVSWEALMEEKDK